MPRLHHGLKLQALWASPFVNCVLGLPEHRLRDVAAARSYRPSAAFPRFGVTHDHGKNWPIPALAAAIAGVAPGAHCGDRGFAVRSWHWRDVLAPSRGLAAGGSELGLVLVQRLGMVLQDA